MRAGHRTGRGSIAGSTPQRILIVDDQAGPRRILQRAFESLGHEMETAADGFDRLAKVRLGATLVVLDAEMPGMDGFEVARRIRQDPEFADLPILMVTGLTTQTDRLRAVEVGINDFIAKPFDPTELQLRSATLIRASLAGQALKRHEADLESQVDRRTAALRKGQPDGTP